MKKHFVFILLFFMVTFVSAQNQTILTAGNFFKSVSEYYATIKDYEASFTINAGGTKMSGKVSFKAPNLLRMDFDDPADQVIVFSDNRLLMYLPLSNATFIQEVEKDSSGSAAEAGNLATPQGLYLMNRYYFIAYEKSQSAEPLTEDSNENVVKLILSRKTVAEGFKTINLAINPETLLIRYIKAVTTDDRIFEFSFTGYILNTNIPDVRFVYDSPSDSNNYYNFLYTE